MVNGCSHSLNKAALPRAGRTLLQDPDGAFQRSPVDNDTPIREGTVELALACVRHQPNRLSSE
jgi:hypothetical protein